MDDIANILPARPTPRAILHQTVKMDELQVAGHI